MIVPMVVFVLGLFSSTTLSEPAVISLDCRGLTVVEGTDLIINLRLDSKPQSARIDYQINYGPNVSKSMRTREGGGSSNAFEVKIPAATFKARDMIRWTVLVEDEGHIWSFSDGSNESSTCGLCVTPLESPPSDSIPVLQWWTNNGSEALTTTGAGGGSLCWNGDFFQDVTTRRRGVTSLSFKKPKLAFKIAGGGFEIGKGRLSVKAFDLSNLYFELGEKSMQKEMLSLQVIGDL